MCCNKGRESVTKRYKDIIETDYYRYNKGKLVEIFGQALAFEKRVLDNEDYEGLAELCNLNSLDFEGKKGLKLKLNSSVNGEVELTFNVKETMSVPKISYFSARIR